MQFLCLFVLFRVLNSIKPYSALSRRENQMNFLTIQSQRHIEIHEGVIPRLLEKQKKLLFLQIFTFRKPYKFLKRIKEVKKVLNSLQCYLSRGRSFYYLIFTIFLKSLNSLRFLIFPKSPLISSK